MSEAESALLEEINLGLSNDLQTRYLELIEKRLAETMSDVEHEEFMDINQQVEQMNVERLRKLATLAQLRQVPLSHLMNQLGISKPAYVS